MKLRDVLSALYVVLLTIIVVVVSIRLALWGWENPSSAVLILAGLTALLLLEHYARHER